MRNKYELRCGSEAAMDMFMERGKIRKSISLFPKSIMLLDMPIVIRQDMPVDEVHFIGGGKCFIWKFLLPTIPVPANPEL
jgi:hypothetical protein